MSLQITRPDNHTWEIDGHTVLMIVPNSTYDGYQDAYVLDNYWTMNTYYEDTVRAFSVCLQEALIQLAIENAVAKKLEEVLGEEFYSEYRQEDEDQE